MKINFNILNVEIDLTNYLELDKNWLFNNCDPKIPLNTEIEDLTDENKKSLIPLAISEGLLELEIIYNLPKESFQINKK